MRSYKIRAGVDTIRHGLHTSRSSARLVRALYPERDKQSGGPAQRTSLCLYCVQSCETKICIMLLNNPVMKLTCYALITIQINEV